MKRVLLIGAGHAHLALLRSLAETPLYGATTMLVTPSRMQVYSGMLPGVIAGHYHLEQAQVDVAALAARAQIELTLGELVALDARRRTVRLKDGNELEYDVASLNAGSIVERSIPGFEHALPVKPFDEFVYGLRGVKRVAIAGAGPGGAELAMALRHAGAQVTLFSEGSSMAPELARRVLRGLRRAGIDFRPGMAVTGIEPGPVVVAGTTHQEFDRVVLATGTAPQPWLRTSGLETDEHGFALVQGTLQSVSHLDVFAVGDCATLRDSPHPKNGVYSVRHGDVLTQNLRNVAEGKPLVPYVPQARALSLITCGRRYAIAEWGGWTAEGHLLWWWKSRIDKRWIRSFNKPQN